MPWESLSLPSLHVYPQTMQVPKILDTVISAESFVSTSSHLGRHSDQIDAPSKETIETN
jgi:hypothetical protein